MLNPRASAVASVNSRAQRTISCWKKPCRVSRGTEKGYFEFGGSTVIVLLPKQELEFDERILKGIREGCEIPVKMGETVAVSAAGK